MTCCKPEFVLQCLYQLRAALRVSALGAVYMDANVATTCNGAVRLTGSPPTRTTTKYLPNGLLAPQTSYEATKQQTCLRRLPSPGRLYSDSEEVSDDDDPEQDQQSSRRVSAQIPVSIYDFELEDHGYRSASPHSSDLEQLSIASQVDRTDPEMDKVAQFVGYSESEFEEESDQGPQSLRSRSHRNGTLLHPNVSKTATDVRSNHKNSTAQTNQSAADVHNKRLVGRKAHKGKANAKESKPAPFEQSSSSEDDESPAGDDIEDGATLHKPLLPPHQTPSQVRPQASPLASRQISVQTSSSETASKSPSQDAFAMNSNTALRGRLQKALAKKGFLSSSHDQNLGMEKNEISNSANLASETREKVNDYPRSLPDEARSANATAHANRLAPNNGVQNTFPSATTQQDLQQQKAQNFPRTQQLASRAGVGQPRATNKPHAMANRPPVYGPFNTSHQNQIGRQKQPIYPPTPAKLDVSKAVDSLEVARKKITKVPHPNAETSSTPKELSDAGRNASTPTMIASYSRPGSPTFTKSGALLNQPSPPSVTSRPTAPTQAFEANPETPPKTATGINALHAESANSRRTITKTLPTNKPMQTKTSSMIPNESRSVGATRTSQQHQKGVSGEATVPKLMQVKSTVTKPKAVHEKKPVQEAGVIGKSSSPSLNAPTPPAKRPAVSALKSILSEVSTGCSTVDNGTGTQAQVGGHLTVEDDMPRQNVRSIPTNGSTPAHPKDGLNETQSSSKESHFDTAAHSALVASGIASSRIDVAISQLGAGTPSGKSGSPGLTRPSTNSNPYVRQKTTENKPLSSGSHSGQGRSSRNIVEALSRISTRQGNTTVNTKHPTSSTESHKAPLPAPSGTLSSVQDKASTASVTKSPPPAQPQVPNSLRTSGTASISSSVTALALPKAPLPDASKVSSLVQIKPPASVAKPTSGSSDFTAAATRGPLKTHTRVPSGPTEDGFDIYIPSAPGTSKAIPTPAKADKVAATPAVLNAPDREASEPINKVAGANNLSYVQENGQGPSSVATNTSTNSIDVSTTAPIRKTNPSMDQVALAGKTAPTTIARDGNDTSGRVAGPRTVEGNTSTFNGVFAQKPGNMATAKKPKDSLSTPHKTKSNQPNPGSLAIVTPQYRTERADSGSELHEIVLRDQPRTGPTPEPYFEYRIKQKIWPESGTDEDADALTVGFSSTVLETANRQAEELFTQTKEQYLYSFPVQHQQSCSGRDDDGCLALTGTLATMGWPVKQVHLRIWVERGEVPSDAVTFNPPPKFTPFLSKTLYILRLYKLIEVPTVGSNENSREEGEMAEDADGDDEASGSEPGDDSSWPDADDNPSESDSDAGKGKHNRKRQAKQVLKGSPRAKRRKIKSASPEPTSSKHMVKSAMSKRVVRQHQQIPCPEIYTTLHAANNAACYLQIEVMNEHTLLGQAAQAKNTAGLKRKLMDLVEKDSEGRYWHNEFPFGLVGAKMEIKVESVTVCGPRNV
ncbi:hypothetical protein PMIN06_002313 [Paraphaeosphaeria minitans]